MPDFSTAACGFTASEKKPICCMLRIARDSILHTMQKSSFGSQGAVLSCKQGDWSFSCGGRAGQLREFSEEAPAHAVLQLPMPGAGPKAS